MDAALLFVVVPAAVTLLFGVIIAIIVVASRRRPEQVGWASAPSGGAGSWNGEILGEGGLGALGATMASTFGTFRLEEGMLSFTPDEAPAPAWWAHCRDLSVGRRGLLALDGADLRIVGPMGDLRCNVSVERINRLSRNTMKDLRERGYAEQFVDLLLGHGARPL